MKTINLKALYIIWGYAVMQYKLYHFTFYCALSTRPQIDGPFMCMFAKSIRTMSIPHMILLK